MNHAGTCFNNWNAGGIADEVDELSSTTGDTEVYITDGVQHLTCSFVSGRQQGYNILRNTILRQNLVNQRHLLAVGAVGILTAFQHTGVTTLEAEREYIERYVRTGLVDHTYNTEGHADTT